MPLYNEEHQIRLKAFEWLEEQTQLHGEVLSRDLLAKGFVFRNTRIHMLGAQGIWKPRVFERIPLSITTVPNGPYADHFDYDENVVYSYRGSDPNHPDNVGLRLASKENTPLIYFFGVEKGRYLPFWPVYVTYDDPQRLRCHVDISARFIQTFRGAMTTEVENVEDVEPSLIRKYAVQMSKVRLHQTAFRERVISAYRCSCAMCNLKHRELLDAAHITPDKDETGEPVISNGLSLCKIHHTAYDKHILGISPDYNIHVRRDILREIDGPMLRHGLQDLHGHKLQYLPARKVHQPDRDRLQQRFECFLNAG